MNKSREKALQRKPVGRSEFVQSLSQNRKDPKDLLEDILGKSVPINDVLKVSMNGAANTQSQTKSVRFSFNKEEIESSSQKHSRGGKPVKPSLMIKNKPNNPTSTQTVGSQEVFDHDYMKRQIKLLVQKEKSRDKRMTSPRECHNNKDIQAEDGQIAFNEKTIYRSLTDKNKGKCSDDEDDEQFEGVVGKKDFKRRHSEELDNSEKIQNDLLECYLDNQSFLEFDPDNERSTSVKNKKDAQLTKIFVKSNNHNTSVSKLRMGSDGSTQCGQLSLSLKKKSEEKQTVLTESEQISLFDHHSLEGAECNSGEKANHGAKQETFTIKEEPSCQEEFLTPNPSANLSVQMGEEDKSAQDLSQLDPPAQPKKKGKYFMFDAILKANDRVAKEEAISDAPIVLMRFNCPPTDQAEASLDDEDDQRAPSICLPSKLETIRESESDEKKSSQYPASSSRRSAGDRTPARSGAGSPRHKVSGEVRVQSSQNKCCILI